MPEPASNGVADDRATNRSRHDETDARSGGVIGSAPEVNDERRGSGPHTAADSGGELGAGTHACRGRQHWRPAVQAESRARPLRRRPARMARPAAGRRRRRTPWVFARRRLFGWNVRLLTEELPTQGPRHLDRVAG